MLIDTHCHLNMLNLDAGQGSLTDLLERAKNDGVQQIICVGVDLVNAPTVLNIAERYENVFASVGLHPSEKVTQEPTIKDLLSLAEHPKVVAIGETGLDYYYNKEGLATMRDRFRMHIQAARLIKKPIIVHSRSASEDTIAILREENAASVGGVMHCFTESWLLAQQAMALGFYISFSGIVTFKNAKNVVEVAEKVPLDRLLIETDAPYLTPEPYRGKPNGPQFVKLVAERLAVIKNTSYAEIAARTSENARCLFSLPSV